MISSRIVGLQRGRPPSATKTAWFEQHVISECVSVVCDFGSGPNEVLKLEIKLKEAFPLYPGARLRGLGESRAFGVLQSQMGLTQKVPCTCPSSRASI